MKNYFIYFILGLFLVSCEIDSMNPYPCPDGSCDAVFVIDTIQNPGSYQDDQGVWHLKHSGLNYFRILGKTDPIHSQYLINNTPSIYTAYDSNYFYIPNQITWSYPVYSYLGLFSNNNLNSPILIENQFLTLPQIINNISVSNIAGYEINKRFNFNHPAAFTMLQTYSKYNYNPTQQMVFFPDMIGDKADIYIKVSWASDWWGVNVEKFYKLSIIFED
jgi:hypothetical protein